MLVSTVAATFLAIGLIAAGCGGKRDTATEQTGTNGDVKCEASAGRITIATGNTGGVYLTFGGGLAQLISDKVHNAASEMSREEAPNTDPVPLHPGAAQALGVSSQ